MYLCKNILGGALAGYIDLGGQNPLGAFEFIFGALRTPQEIMTRKYIW